MKKLILDDIEVAYEEFGEGRPVVILHGWSLDHTCEMLDFEPIFEERPGWRRIYLDLPGHGRTPGAEEVDNMDAILEVILASIDYLAQGERLAVVGTSAGALPARGIVYRRPEQVCGLLLRIPLIVADDHQRDLPDPAAIVEDKSFMDQLPAKEIEIYGDMIVQKAGYYETVKQFVERIIDPALARGDSKYLEKIRQDPLPYGFSFDVDALPEPFPGPCLFLAGRQDAAVGYRDGWPLLDNYPRGQLCGPGPI